MRKNRYFLPILMLILLLACLGVNEALAQGSAVPFSQVYTPQRIGAFRQVVRYYNPSIREDVADRISRAIIRSAHLHGIEDDRFVAAVITVESMFNPYAVSRSGAQGLGQLMPGTARDLRVNNSFDIEENIDGSCRYLKKQLQRFAHLDRQRRYELTLAAYNAGPGAVARFGGIPPYQETRDYVVKVINVWRQLCGHSPASPGSVAGSGGTVKPQPVTRAKITRHYVYTTYHPPTE